MTNQCPKVPTAQRHHQTPSISRFTDNLAKPHANDDEHQAKPGDVKFSINAREPNHVKSHTTRPKAVGFVTSRPQTNFQFRPNHHWGSPDDSKTNGAQFHPNWSRAIVDWCPNIYMRWDWWDLSISFSGHLTNTSADVKDRRSSLVPTCEKEGKVVTRSC